MAIHNKRIQIAAYNASGRAQNEPGAKAKVRNDPKASRNTGVAIIAFYEIYDI